MAGCGDDDNPPEDVVTNDEDTTDEGPADQDGSSSATSEGAETLDASTSPGSTGNTDAEDAGSSSLDRNPTDGSGSDGGAPPDVGPRSWIVGGWLLTEEGYFGYLTILDDLSADGEVDLGKVHQFDGDITYTSAGDGSVLVGQEDVPTLERWVVNEAGDGLEKDGEINFDYFAVTSTLGNGVIQVIDEQTAWYFDAETYQAIVFNPTTMTTDGVTVDFSGILEQDYNIVLGYVSRLDDALVISAQYWDADWNALSLTRAAVIDIESQDVEYADDTRCGSTRFHAKDDEGNLYIGAHPGEALWQAAGLGAEDAPKACIIRMKSGETEFDSDYYVDLQEASGGRVVGGFMQGDDGHAYVYEFTGDIQDVDGDTYNGYLKGDNWALARIELGNEAESYTLVDHYEASTAYGTSFSVVVGDESVRYVISANSSFESGKYYDLSDPTDAVPALSFPGFPGDALNY